MHFIHVIFVIAQVSPHQVAEILEGYFNRHVERPERPYDRMVGMPKTLIFRKIKWEGKLPKKNQMKSAIVNQLRLNYTGVNLQDVDIHYEKPSYWDLFGNKLVIILGVVGALGAMIAFVAWVWPYAISAHP